MPKTVVLLNPYGGDVTAFVNGTPLIPQLLMGTVMQSGDTLYTLPYNNLIATAANITAAEALLNTKLLALAAASSQPILVFAYSMGCEVADKWITVNEHLNQDALGVVIGEAMRDIKVRDFLEAFYD